MTQQSREALGMFATCVAAFAVFVGMRPLLPLPGYIYALFAVGALIMAILTIAVDMRFGVSLKKSLGKILIVGVVTFGTMYGIMWWFITSLSNKPAFHFGI